MWRPDHGLLAQQLTDHFGIELSGRALPSAGGHPAFEIFPSDCAPSDAFRLVFRTKWRSLEMAFEPGAYSGELITQMGDAPPDRLELFRNLAGRCITERARLKLTVNDEAIPVQQADQWPPAWRRVEIELLKAGATVNTDDFIANDAEVLQWARRFTGLVLALVPIEEKVESVVENHEGLPEGSVVRVEVNRYERSRINRAACIEIHGSICKVCEFSFAAAYGPTGDGYIHVHHITPVSALGPDYRVNPSTDLVPLCANCHAIAHRKTPPFSPDEIRALLLN